MVHAKALEIRWHDQMPIFSADFHAFSPEQHRRVAHPYALAAGAGPSTEAGSSGATTSGAGSGKKKEEEKLWRLATAGGDKLVRIWLVHPRPTAPPMSNFLANLATATASTPKPSVAPVAAEDAAAGSKELPPRVEYLATLKQHTGVVNVVRFCPVGEMLASAGDDGNILFWVPGEPTAQYGESHEDKAYEKESWRVKHMLRTKSGQEIYDLAWSPDGSMILAGSVDHTANIYDVSSGQLLHTIAEHTNYVQGVAWDPHGQYISTQSSDRSMHVYSLTSPLPSTSSSTPTSTFSVHAVGKSSRMEVHHPSTSSASLPWGAPPPPPSHSHDLPTLPLPSLRRTVSQRSMHSDSDRSEASSTSRFSSLAALSGYPSLHGGAETPSSALDTGDAKEEDETPMDPPSSTLTHPGRPSSRRSSTSGSQPPHGGNNFSPLLGPADSRSRSDSHTRLSAPLRSPSPAPLPAVRAAPPSPKLGSASVPGQGVGGRNETIKLYGDANSTPFFRRLCWSTDGSLLLTPAGLWVEDYAPLGGVGKLKKDGATGEKEKEKEKEKASEKDGPKPTVYIYSRSNVARPPIAHLPGHKTTSIAIRFCPVLWRLRALPTTSTTESGREEEEADAEPVNIPLGRNGVEMPLPGSGLPSWEEKGGGERRSLFDLPYRMVYAVATLDAVYLYDTQQASPVCMFGNLHYAPFTDLTWSSDGQTLVVSSQDGYCSVIAFAPLELGTPYEGPTPVPQSHLLPPSAPALPPTASGALPAMFAAASSSSSSSTKEMKEPASGSVVPEKRKELAPADGTSKDVEGKTAASKGEGEDAPPPKKQKKKATLQFLGPLGGASS